MTDTNINLEDKANFSSPLGARDLYDFDEIIDRHNTGAVKIERCKALYGTDDVLPLWVADMDFRTPDFIIEAIRERCEHPILGYSMPPKEFYPTVIEWISEHHQWNIDRQWIGFLPGIVPGLSFSVQSLTSPGDEVIVQPPVYYPFFHVIKNNNRVLVNNPLKTVNGKFEMDFEDLEQKITSKTKLFILCSPHNPGGKVWNAESLKRLAEICSKHNITVVSDEIHADMVLEGYKHIPFATVSEEAAKISLTFMAPSKTFNMPGLISSSYIITNKEIRTKFVDFLESSELTGGNIFAYAATVAAFEKGNDWRKQMLEYVQGNIDFVVDFLKTNIPQITPMIPEASFLVWLNCQELGMETDDLFDFFAQKAGLGLNKGTIFGPGGEYHLRLNVACPRSILQKAMKQLKDAVTAP
ncbi:MAG: putative C-S lyase [Paludibacter sp.]|nr:putative C-S lyase [Paludibacter sp.]